MKPALRICFVFATFNANAFASDFAGEKACAACHATIATTQGKTAMALTWRGEKTELLPAALAVHHTESPGANSFTFGIERKAEGLEVSSAQSGAAKTVAPVRVVMGGQRHGLSFLAWLEQLDGISLARPVLLESRFAWSTSKHQLGLSPGFPEEPPATLDEALGRPLSPTVEKKCVTCHGQPGSLEAGSAGGVHCENCHGAGREHLLAVGRGKPHEGIINPARLSADGRMAVCAPCHTGFTRQSDPLPDDVLVSNQVNALGNSECFIQSGKRLGCTSCHDPHDDSQNTNAMTVKACLGCHSASGAEAHAATCPVNAKDGCVTCHMPSIEKGSFHMVDHWIRVHPEQNVKAAHAPGRSQIPPLREFVRIISTPTREEAESASARLAKGDTFFQVAREASKDATAPVGGYLGAMWLSQFDPKLSQAAERLAYAQISAPVDLSNHWIIVQRLPRDFKYEANLLFEQAVALRAKGDRKAALEKYQQALIIYPNFLRALVGMGTAFAESGDIASGAGVLNYAVQVYPEDADAEFNFGITLGGMGRHDDELKAYRHAIELNPDQGAVYENLGAACSASGDVQGAIDAFRTGLQIDPLSAVLYYDLSLVLTQTGDKEAAQKALALAIKIDPRIAKR